MPAVLSKASPLKLGSLTVFKKLSGESEDHLGSYLLRKILFFASLQLRLWDNGGAEGLFCSSSYCGEKD